MSHTKHEMYTVAMAVCEKRCKDIYDIISSVAEEGLFECNIYTEKDLELFIREKDEVDSTLRKIKAIEKVLEAKGFKVYLKYENKCLKGYKEYFNVVEYLTISWY